MSAKTVEAAIKGAVKCVTGLNRECGLKGLREVNEEGWKDFAEAFFLRHAPLNFKVSVVEGVLPPEDHDQYVESFVIAAKHAAEGYLTAN